MHRIPLVFVLTATLAACAGGGNAATMTKLSAPTAAAIDASAATIVFVRPETKEGAVHHVILDETGRFLGESWGQTSFAAKVSPGEHTFISYVEGNQFGDGPDRKPGTPALRATVEAGKVYYVEVVPVPGAYSTRARLMAMGPSRDGWAKLPDWLRQTQALAPNEAAGQARLKARLKAEEIVQKGLRSYAEYAGESREKLEQRTITPADGVATPIAPR